MAWQEQKMERDMQSEIETKPTLAPLKLGSRSFTSRLIAGTGKYASFAEMGAALDAAQVEVVTVAVRRERLVNDKGESLLDHLDLGKSVV